MRFPQAIVLLSLVAVGLSDATNLVTHPAADCGLNPVDIHFLLDESGSVGSSNFQITLEFVKNFAAAFNIGPTKAQIGVTTFSSVPRNQFWMNDHPSNASLLPAILAIPYSGGGTNTGAALDFVRQNAFTQAHGARNGVMKILIVITDGKSNDKAATVAAAARVHQTNIMVLAVGVGTNLDQSEMQSMATDPTRLFHVDNYQALHFIQDKLRKKACEVCPFWTGTNAVMIDGKCVRLFQNPSKWSDAKTACEAEGPHVNLLEMTTPALRDFVMTKTKEIKTRTWLGGTDEAVEGTWVWAGSGLPAVLQPSWWGKGQPDNNNGNEDCLIMRPDKKLNDYNCRRKLPYFCESVEVKQVTTP